MIKCTHLCTVRASVQCTRSVNMFTGREKFHAKLSNVALASAQERRTSSTLTLGSEEGFHFNVDFEAGSTHVEFVLIPEQQFGRSSRVYVDRLLT